MENVKFFHKTRHDEFYKDHRYTAAIEMPSKNDLLDLMGFGPKHLFLNVGKASVHPKDQYVRKIGREIAVKNIKRIKYSLSDIRYPSEDSLVLTLVSENLEDPIRVVQMKIFFQTQKVYLMNVLS